ncbi:NAD-dependent epimerase/dehydratase family protein [Modicisalibacter luteus]|uniref:NAD-dependent epimerase/dehydratase family protein n=1 Tax=Modicisalibacter luteus TaxID=453962 RepID=A0ABV7M743_9GAMM|nr:NAD-dependent epimerase/dehydratase family protein [Halomonas lutea]
MNILITGASGFVGRRLLATLAAQEGVFAQGASRRASRASGQDIVRCGNLSATCEWQHLLNGMDVVVHCAARAHVLNDSTNDPWAAFYQANVQGTLSLASQAVQAGVKRFVFISTIGVNGSKNTIPFTEHHLPQPVDPYARSKWQAEVGLKDIAKKTGLELVIVRPPLIYGPDAPGNFGLLSTVATKGLPLPLAGINNRRSFVSVWNLVDFIMHCINHPNASGETFLVADGEDVSTSELLYKLARAAGRPSRLFWLPASWLKAGATALGKRGVYDRLFDSLQVDASHARRTLGWVPPLSLDDGLERCFLHQDEGCIS